MLWGLSRGIGVIRSDTLSCWPCLLPEAGVSARRRTHFLLLRQKKVSKEKATLLSASLRCATGNLRCSIPAGVRRTRFAQTAAALIPPASALLGAYRRGGSGRPSLPLGPNTSSQQPIPYQTQYQPPQALRACGGLVAERSKGPCGSPAPLYAPRSGAFRGSGPQLFERSEFCGPRETRAPQVAP